MKVKVSELEGRALNYAVAVCVDGVEIKFDTMWCFKNVGFVCRSDDKSIPIRGNEFDPSGNWAHGGPKLEEREISVAPVHEYPDDYDKKWVGEAMKRGNISMGSTYLESGMRAFILSYTGGTDNQKIEIPDELMP